VYWHEPTSHTPDGEGFWVVSRHADALRVLLEHVGRELYESNDAVRAANAGIRSYGTELIAHKRREPADDMLSVVIHAALPGEDPPSLTDAELYVFFMLLFVAGSETTRKAIAVGLAALLETGEWERLQREPGRIDTAIEEIVRWTTPSVYKRRTLTRDVELGGQRLRAGDKLTFWEMSANRDDAVFEYPFRFDIGRDPNPHLGFGHSVHYCLGANLARLEIRVMLEELLALGHAIEITGDPVWTRDNRLFGLKHLPVRFDPR
jgi:Cytochrome P450